MSDTNEYEERCRAAKAYRLVRFIEKKGWTTADVETFSDGAWFDLATLTDTHPPSDRTKAIVLHILRDRSDG